MRRAISILIALIAFLAAFIAANVSVMIVPRIRANIANGVPTMFLGRYRLDGLRGFVVPVGLGLIAAAFVAIGTLLIVRCKGKR